MFLAAVSQINIATAMPPHPGRPGRVRPLHLGFDCILGHFHHCDSHRGQIGRFLRTQVVLHPGPGDLHDRLDSGGLEPVHEPAHRFPRGHGRRWRNPHGQQFRGRGRSVPPGRTGPVHRVDQPCLRHVFGDRAAVGRFHHRRLFLELGLSDEYPAGIPVLWLLARTFPEIAPRVDKRKLDYPGMVALALAVASLMIALSLGGVHYQWSSLQVSGLLGFGLAMAVIFLVVESKADSPIMPLGIYTNRAVAVSVTVTVLTGFGLHSTALFTPLFFQGVLGSTATGSGGLLTPHDAWIGVWSHCVRAATLQNRWRLPQTGPDFLGSHGGGHLSHLHHEREYEFCPGGGVCFTDRAGAGRRHVHLQPGRPELGALPAGRQRDLDASVLQVVQRYAGSGRVGSRLDGELLIQVGRIRPGIRQSRACPRAVGGPSGRIRGCLSTPPRSTRSGPASRREGSTAFRWPTLFSVLSARRWSRGWEMPSR